MNRIFLTGLFRSGTTLLCRALSANPDIYISYQPLTPLFKAATNKFYNEIGIKRGKPLGDPVITEQYWASFHKQIDVAMYSQQELTLLKKKLRENLNRDVMEKDSIWSDLFRNLKGQTFTEMVNEALSLFEEKICRTNGKHFVGFKEIWSEDFLPIFAKSGYKCVHIVRDLRGVVASRNYGRYLTDGCSGKKYPILFICRSWRRGATVYEKLNGKKNYLMVQYERFLKSPEKTMRLICDFLGASFLPEMIDLQYFCGGDGVPWRGNVDSKKFIGIDNSRSDSWKSILSEDDVFLCEFLCFDEMQQLGYSPVSNYEDQERFMKLKEDSNAAGSWLSQFDHTLTEEQKNTELARKKALG